MAKSSGRASVVVKLLVVGFVLVLIVFAYFQYRDEFTPENLARREEQIRAYYDEHPIACYAAAFTAYTAVTALSLPFAVPMSLGIGWLFGFTRGVVVVSFASTTGATLAFLLSRYLLRDAIQNKLGERLERFNRAWEREGAFYLFTLRLIPAVPFWMINVAMGLTPIRIGTFWWVSQLGMLAGTCVYVYAGASLPGLAQAARGEGILTPQLIGAFVLLGAFPLVTKKIIGRFRAAPPAGTDDAA